MEEQESSLAEETRKELKKYERRGLSEEDAMKILKLIWRNAPDEEVRKAASLCAAYKLNPLMKQVYLVPYETKKGGEVWEIILGINAIRTLARRAKNFGYVDGPRVMSKEEQERILGRYEPDRIWTICKVRDREGNEAVGYGNYPKDKSPLGADKGNTPVNMAFIRAERDALQKLCPAEMPLGFEMMDERFLEKPVLEEEEYEVREKTLESTIEKLQEAIKSKDATIAELQAELAKMKVEYDELKSRLESATKTEQGKLFQ